ncbi:MAG: PaaI family thioesterase [Ilumatobacteraceae bacterium]
MNDIADDQPESGVSVSDINEFLARDFTGAMNTCEAIGKRWAVARMTPSESNLRPGSIISGQTVFGLCDATLYYACFTVIGIEPMVLTSEMSIRYLRPARGDVLRARAVLDHAGKRSLIGTVTVWTDAPERPVAVAQGTYVVPVPRG